jgi:hypothetical protein
MAGADLGYSLRGHLIPKEAIEQRPVQSSRAAQSVREAREGGTQHRPEGSDGIARRHRSCGLVIDRHDHLHRLRYANVRFGRLVFDAREKCSVALCTGGC